MAFFNVYPWPMSIITSMSQPAAVFAAAASSTSLHTLLPIRRCEADSMIGDATTPRLTAFHIPWYHSRARDLSVKSLRLDSGFLVQTVKRIRMAEDSHGDTASLSCPFDDTNDQSQFAQADCLRDLLPNPIPPWRGNRRPLFNVLNEFHLTRGLWLAPWSALRLRLLADGSYSFAW